MTKYEKLVTNGRAGKYKRTAGDVLLAHKPFEPLSLLREGEKMHIRTEKGRVIVRTGA